MNIDEAEFLLEIVDEYLPVKDKHLKSAHIAIFA